MSFERSKNLWSFEHRGRAFRVTVHKVSGNWIAIIEVLPDGATWESHRSIVVPFDETADSRENVLVSAVRRAREYIEQHGA